MFSKICHLLAWEHKSILGRCGWTVKEGDCIWLHNRNCLCLSCFGGCFHKVSTQELDFPGISLVTFFYVHLWSQHYCLLLTFVIFSDKSTRPWFHRCLLFCWSVQSSTWKYFWLRHFKELHLHLVGIHHYHLWLSGYHNNVGNLSKRTLIYLKIGNAYIYMEYIVSRSIS